MLRPKKEAQSAQFKGRIFELADITFDTKNDLYICPNGNEPSIIAAPTKRRDPVRTE